MASVASSKLDHCSHGHTDRLFVGEGNFTYTEAVLAKHSERHPSLGESITATELRTHIECDTCIGLVYDSGIDDGKCDKCAETAKRIEWLSARGVTILFDVDATRLHTTEGLAGKLFPRIHWNFPHDGSKKPAGTMPDIIDNFFQSCSRMQDPSGRVYISIIQPFGEGAKAWYQAGVHELISNASKNSYVLHSKRNFGRSRYPKYKHLETARNASNKNVGRSREFVFEKISRADRHRIDGGRGGLYEDVFLERMRPFSTSGYQVRIRELNSIDRRAYYNCDTDPGSSDYSDDEWLISAVDQMETDAALI